MSSFCGPRMSREASSQRGDDLGRLVDGERRLGGVGELLAGARRQLDRLHLVGALDEDRRVRRLAHRPDHLLVAGVPDQDDRVALARVPFRLRVHLRHERAGRVDHGVVESGRVLVHRWRDPVRGVDDRRALGHVALVVDEDRAACLEVADDVDVVDDLLADVDGSAVVLERPLDRLDRPLDAGAVAAGRSQEDAADHLATG